MAEELPMRGTIEAKDPFSMAPPGYGLTSDNERWPWGKPQEEANPEVVLSKAVDSLEVPHVREEMMKLLMVGASVESLVEGYIFQAFQEGGFSPDVGLLIMGPLGLYIASVAEEENVPYRLFENENALTEDEMDDTTFFSMMRNNNPAMFAYVSEKINESYRRGDDVESPKEDNFMSMKKDKKES
jgi:heat shock protein HspQ